MLVYELTASNRVDTLCFVILFVRNHLSKNIPFLYVTFMFEYIVEEEKFAKCNVKILLANY